MTYVSFYDKVRGRSLSASYQASLYERYSSKPNLLRSDILKAGIIFKNRERLEPVEEAPIEASMSIERSLEDRARDNNEVSQIPFLATGGDQAWLKHKSEKVPACQNAFLSKKKGQKSQLEDSKLATSASLTDKVREAPR
jgi:hypothetical protein